MRRTLIWLLLLLQLAASAHASEDILIGILAYRPADEVLQRWQPTADYLSIVLPGYRFRVQPMGYRQLTAAIETRQVDFVLTNPSHHVEMTHRFSVTSPLASLVRSEQEQPVSAFGGVIAVAADREDLQQLSDLKGKRVATPGPSSLGGYQVQALELRQAGVKLPDDADLLYTEMPHTGAIDLLLSGQVDAAFFRTGLLEQLAEDGQLDPGRVRILNRQQVPAFPFALSTRLYPEWPLTALPHVDDQLLRKVIAALFLIAPQDRVAQLGGYHNWSIPHDYQPVIRLLEELRLPPFDTAPQFTIDDVWSRYRQQIIGAFASFLIILVLLVGMILMNRRLTLSRRELGISEEKYRRLVENLSSEYFLYRTDIQGNLQYISPSASAMLGYEPRELLTHYQKFLVDHPVNKQVAVNTRLALKGERQPPYLFVARHKAGHDCWMEVSESPVFDEQGQVIGLEGIVHDVTQRKQLEEELRQLATTDTLTNLPNRRSFLERLEQELARIHRFTEQPATALLMLDLDHFKQINDVHGHAMGDEVLRSFADCIRRLLRKTDTAGRLGGEEFAVLLTGASLEGAQIFAERLRVQTAALRFAGEQGEVKITLSQGLTLLRRDDESVDASLARADKALYRAKERGRNRVEIN